MDLPTHDPDDPNTVVFGQVVGIHIADWAIKDGHVDTVALKPVGRLGYLDYVCVDESFSMERPTWP